jgi:tRNA threonylcarbamoyladenosine biosynthesis protein TsaE
MSEKTVKVNSLDEMKRFAANMALQLTPKQLLLLEGPMGAGKTQFVRFLVEALRGQKVSSPTFAIHNQYESARGSIDHVDLYRIESESELEATGFWDLFAKPEGLIIVEWSDRLDSSIWPPNWRRLRLKLEVPAAGSTARTIHLSSD